MKWLILIGLKIVEIIGVCLIMGISAGLIYLLTNFVPMGVFVGGLAIVGLGVMIGVMYQVIKQNLEWSNRIALWLKKRKEK